MIGSRTPRGMQRVVEAYNIYSKMVELDDQFLEFLDQMLPSMNSDPPFEETYKALFLEHISSEQYYSYLKPMSVDDTVSDNYMMAVVEERELPLIDLARLSMGKSGREECMVEMSKASEEWGFFQVVNHGISRDVLEAMRQEQIKVFREPFYRKMESHRYMNTSPGSYRWGTPTATCLHQLSWSEAFHIPFTDIPRLTCTTSIRSALEQYAVGVSSLAQKVAKILAKRVGRDSVLIEQSCQSSTCYLRMNRYPPCPKLYSQVFGLMPHTDSDFLTILYQDYVGGLQLVKDGKWIAVKPNPDALIVNIGDLFQAWSNGVYKSVEHRVVANGKVERFSTAYFLCPSSDAVIESCKEPSVYRKFSFREYRQQVQDDVKNLGHKIGLSRFLV
ncbi:Gibberellin 2-beta-dioxygenase 8, variant 2 [Dionaea muscipula]